jgi:hypothetical protein
MLYSGYNFSKWPDGSIEMDEELSQASIEVSEGDRFVIQIVNGKIVFRKVPKPAPVEKTE